MTASCGKGHTSAAVTALAVPRSAVQQKGAPAARGRMGDQQAANPRTVRTRQGLSGVAGQVQGAWRGVPMDTGLPCT